jgi:hypothetical protein
MKRFRNATQNHSRMGKQKEMYTKRAILYQLQILYIAQTNIVDGITARHTGNISIVNNQNDRFFKHRFRNTRISPWKKRMRTCCQTWTAGVLPPARSPPLTRPPKQQAPPRRTDNHRRPRSPAGRSRPPRARARTGACPVPS